MRACVEQKSIAVEDLSPLAIYALRKAHHVPRSSARSDGAEDKHAAEDDDDQQLLTDDAIKVRT